MTRTEALEFCRTHFPDWKDDGRLSFAPGYYMIDGKRVHVLDISIPDEVEGTELAVSLCMALMVALHAAELAASLSPDPSGGAAHRDALRRALDALRERLR